MTDAWPGPVGGRRPEDDRDAALAQLRSRLELLSAEAAASPAGGEQPPMPADEQRRAAQQQAKAVCVRLLADSARPRADLERALRKRGFEPDVIGPVLDRFEEVGLVDDRAYADAFVRSAYRHRALSRTALAAKLRSKGVDSELASTAAADIDDAAEEVRAAELVAKKVEALRDLEPEVARRRLLGLLARRGYPGDVSIRVVDAAMNHSKGE